MYRPLIFGSIFVLALTACSSGGAGGSGGMSPTTPQYNTQQVQSAAVLTAQPSFAFPQTAPAGGGVRTYVHLPLRNSAQLDQLIQEQSTRGSSVYHQFLTPAQFRQQYAPTLQSLQTVASTLQSEGFTTTFTSQGVIADAPQATIERAFGIHLSTRTIVSAEIRGTPTQQLAADRAPMLPAALTKLGATVAAFAPLPAPQAQHVLLSKQPAPQNRYGPYGGYWFDDLKQAYAYPSYRTNNGTGKTIAVIEASDVLDSDMTTYFGYENLSAPNLVRRPVDGGPAAFNPASGVALEATLDVQQAGGSAPGATIMLYGAPDASIVPSFLDMYTATVDDDKADVVSTSFGECELDFTAAYNGGTDFTYLEQDFHDVYRQGNAEGITFVNSSGDYGAYECPGLSGGAVLGVIWPANDPNVTGVGGTNLETRFVNGSLDSAYVSENAHFDSFGSGFPSIWGSGGGISTLWPKPPYQNLVNTGSTMRTVPDVSMHMGGCPVGAIRCGRCTAAELTAGTCTPLRSYDLTVFGGGFYGVIGTSASAPEFAGLQALQDDVLGRAGNVNNLLYALATIGSVGNGPIFHNDIPGNNGYPTHPGYNMVLGNGTVYGAQYAFDPLGPFAGIPQTPSNP